MTTKEEYWAARDDIENQHRALIDDLTRRFKGMNSGIGQNQEMYDKRRKDFDVGYNEKLKGLNSEFKVIPRQSSEDGKTYLDRINNHLADMEEENGREARDEFS